MELEDIPNEVFLEDIQDLTQAFPLEFARNVADEVGRRHLAGKDKRCRAGEQTEQHQQATAQLQHAHKAESFVCR